MTSADYRQIKRCSGVEGVLGDDNHVPARFFSWRTDDQLLGIARQRFEVLDFHVVQVGPPLWFQSLTLRPAGIG